MDSRDCQSRMKQALGRDAGRNFQLSESEVCAGGEEGKDACDGDGGAPLVCQSKDNRWNVVGIVTWGVDCGQVGVPGVYADVPSTSSLFAQPNTSKANEIAFSGVKAWIISNTGGEC